MNPLSLSERAGRSRKNESDESEDLPMDDIDDGFRRNRAASKKFRQYLLKRDFLAIFPEAECYRMFGL